MLKMYKNSGQSQVQSDSAIRLQVVETIVEVTVVLDRAIRQCHMLKMCSSVLKRLPENAKDSATISQTCSTIITASPEKNSPIN